jgi:NodT family efflux transporter outer membrane factor (OMF) lipoprotein
MEYINNGFKVGPNYCRPPAPVAKDWIDAADVRGRKESDDLSKWWTVFHDPVLDSLVCGAYQQNISLREAGFRVLQARAQLGFTVGRIFPQTQNMNGDYQRIALSKEVANRQFIADRFYSQWDFGFSLAWELDFWGKFRRAIEAARDELDASVESYDDVLVTLLGDVAADYVQYRTFEEQIKFVNTNITLQRQILAIAQAKFKGGQVSELDVDQALSTLAQTEALVPELEINLRKLNDALCVLLGIPPVDLKAKLGTAPIPTAPPEVAAGVPADLLRRRPDVRRAERVAAAQCARIGIADADFYPAVSINGNLGWSAEELKDLFRSTAFRGNITPSFRWDLLNYGRILNNVLKAEAQFQELVAAYQQTVLQAGAEVEDGLVTFLRAQLRARFQAESVEAALKAVKIAIVQYQQGMIDFNRVALLDQNLVQQQDTLAQAQGQIALGLVQVYKALGGGWQIRCTGCPAAGPPSPLPDGATPPTDETLPAPRALPEVPVKATAAKSQEGGEGPRLYFSAGEDDQ